MLKRLSLCYHYQTQIVLLIAAVFGTYGLKAVTEWPTWVYPLIAIVGVVVAAAREIYQALDERDALAVDTESNGSKA